MIRREIFPGHHTEISLYINFTWAFPVSLGLPDLKKKRNCVVRNYEYP